MKKCGHDKKNFQKCHRNGYNFEFYLTLKLQLILLMFLRAQRDGNFVLYVSVSASYCIPQCVRRIAGVCTHYVVYNVSKKKNTVDKSKIKDKRKVKPRIKAGLK